MKRVFKFLSAWLILALIRITTLPSNLFAAPKPLGPIQDDISRWTMGGDNSQAIVKLEDVLSTVIGFLTIFAGLYFMISFIIGGIGWTTAGGETDKVEKAKNRMTNGAIGLIIVIVAYSVIYIIGRVLGIDILDLQGTFNELLGNVVTGTNRRN